MGHGRRLLTLVVVLVCAVGWACRLHAEASVGENVNGPDNRDVVLSRRIDVERARGKDTAPGVLFAGVRVRSRVDAPSSVRRRFDRADPCAGARHDPPRTRGPPRSR